MPARIFFTVMLLIGFFCPGALPGKSVLPNEFEKLVPLYPSAQAVETRYTRESMSVKFATDDSYERVSRFYIKALEEAGWLILPVVTAGVINAKKSGQGKGGNSLSIKEAPSMAGHPSNFIIDLYFPGGRE